PSRLRPGVPGDLETICLQCLRKEPAHRYASAADLADDLGNYLAGEPIRARPVTAWERLWGWARRRPGGTAPAAGSVLGRLLLLAGWLHFTARLQMAYTHVDGERARAVEQEAETSRQLQRAKRALYTTQLWRVAGLWDRDPAEALRLL